jgi:phospholipid/cholesterol/gamma-HCH transport system substrate-binding protein
MAKQASKTVIGGFVISAIAVLIAAVIVFGSGKMFDEKVKYVMFFDKSVKGLSVGSSVVCRGVAIGTITDIVLDIDSGSFDIDVPVFAEIYPNRLRVKGERPEDRDTAIHKLIQRGMRAQLSLESIVTGQMMVEIVFLPDTPAHLTGLEPDYYEIPTVGSAMDKFAQKLEHMPLQKISETLLSVLQNIDRVLGSQELMGIVKNLEAASKGVGGLIVDVDKELNTLLRGLGRRVDTVSVDIEAILNDAQKLVADASKEIHAVGGDARKLLENVDGLVQPVGDETREVLTSARQAMDQARTTLKDIDGFVGDKSDIRRKLGRSMDEIAAAARSLKSLMDYLERHPESLLKGKGSRGG